MKVFTLTVSHAKMVVLNMCEGMTPKFLGTAHVTRSLRVELAQHTQQTSTQNQKANSHQVKSTLFGVTRPITFPQNLVAAYRK